jgi:hypothetical protein
MEGHFGQGLRLRHQRPPPGFAILDADLVGQIAFTEVPTWLEELTKEFITEHG